MSEPQPNQEHEPQHAANEPVSETETVSPEQAPETAEITEQLTQARTRGDALAELLLTRSIEQAAGTVLQDVTDLPRDGDYYAEDGTPDLDKIRTAAEALTTSKPHLAKVRGEIHQAPQQRDEPVPTFGELARLAMRR